MAFKICVSGAAKGDCISEKNMSLSRDLGEEIAKQGGVILTGATTGLPHYSTIGAKRKRGMSIGFSPAISHKEHVKKYQLPTNFMDLIIYTGYGYSGRNLMMIRSSDAVIFVCGRIGTLNEFTNAFEEDKPIGILTESGGIADELKDIIRVAKRGDAGVFYDDDPAELVKKLISFMKSRDSSSAKKNRLN
jgi:uncharacterized protein (TIGR00725 family)